MKNISALVVISFFVLISCDIDREPYDSKTSDEVLGSEEGIETSTIGNYAILKGDVGEGQAWIDQLERIGEYGGDNLSWSGPSTDEASYFYSYKNITNNGRSNTFWVESYKAIGGINKLIDAYEEDGEDYDEDKENLIGENYYMRALVYFGLVNAYGRPYTEDPSANGVPLKLTSGEDDIPDRSSVEDVYAQIVEDLDDAESLITEDKGNAFASVSAVKALLSRVYLYMDKNEEAADYADQVIESGKYSLLPTSDLPKYSQKDPEDNPETIFALVRNEDSDYDDGYNTIGGLYSVINGKGWGEIYASSSYLDLINRHPEDARKDFIDPQYKKDDNGDRTPAVYWVSDNYKDYKYKETYTENGKTYFDDDGTEREVKEEEDGDVTKYYFENSSNQKVYVTKDYAIDKRDGYPKFYINKNSLQQGVAQLWSPIISRLAEMYLNRAEANAKLGNDGQALEDVNKIRERAGIPAYSGADDLPEDTDVLDAVLQERRLELAYEGWRKFDVFRNNRTLNREYPGAHLSGSNAHEDIAPDDDRVILYIPQQQIDVQPSLEQNP